ncbi:MAG TPA: ParA family protein [Verrucomicrobiae bacterium]|nr:ParA family protein [Verrucomicrobiae bacterium]
MLRLVIANQRGGVSKTTTVATLAHIYAGRGLRVLAIDADPQGSLGLVLGLRPARYLYDSLFCGRALDECVVPAAANLDVLCSNRDTAKIEAALAGTAGRQFVFRQHFEKVDAAYDAVLIDVAPSISITQTCAMVYARRLLVPVAMDMLSLQGAAACLQTASMLAQVSQCEIRPVALLPARVDRRYALTAFVLSALEEMSKRYAVPLLTGIRTDGNVPKAERARQFLVDYDCGSRASQDYLAAADELMALLNAAEQTDRYPEARSA